MANVCAPRVYIPGGGGGGGGVMVMVGKGCDGVACDCVRCHNATPFPPATPPPKKKNTAHLVLVVEMA